ncbi:hypothetical protein CTAYLR_003715 [Chrysophaeum taylorii]|uniref:Glutathione S-transferase n=1 Tax=Chrysophaeum taylorii TaxID=2483200 RepID=A0AAD7UN11_9STRA|nr:hypothetical protein CTAYLR_003715 [Chrysophaeum taylorii]
MYVLYGGGVSRSLITEMVLVEGSLPYKLVDVDITSGEHLKPEFRKINPAGFVPALVTPSGEVLHEAAATALFLCEAHDLDLVPVVGDAARGRFLSRYFFQTNDLQPPTKQCFYPHRFACRDEDVDAVREAARSRALERWRVVDSWLGVDGPYILGDRFSLADLHLAMWAAFGLGECDRRAILEACPNVARLVDRCAARPKSGPLLKKLLDRQIPPLGRFATPHDATPGYATSQNARGARTTPQGGSVSMR